MGALTSNRKRGNDFSSLNYITLVSNSSKKPKLSINQTPNTTPLPVKSAVQWFFKYPEPINPIRRQVHAPCRQSRFGSKHIGSYKAYSEYSAPEMGNYLSRKYDEVKRSALDSIRCLKKDKEVIDIEEMEAGVCEKSDLFGQKWKETSGNVEIKRSGLDSLRCSKNDKEVIYIDDDSGKDSMFTDDSSIEVVGAGCCEKSDLFGQKWKEADGFVDFRRSALDSLRCLNEDREVIDIDDDSGKESIFTEDSSIDVVEAGCCGKCDLLEQKRKETDGFVETLDGFDGNDSSVVTTGLDDGDPKEENVGKMLDSLALNPTPDSHFYVPLYKKLLGSVEKINNKLKRLRFQIGYHEKRRETYSLLQPQKKGGQVREAFISEAFVPLAKEDEAEVSRAFSKSNRRRVLVTHENSNIDITGEMLQCLRPKQWLNDEVINVYLELLKEREKREPQKFLKCHFFNTFFYKKLISGRGGYNYQSVRRWTSQRKLGYSLFECDKIFVPIHKEIHWCLAVINKKDKKFQYLDSFRGRDTQVLRVLARYFVDEVKDKSGKDIDVSSWKQEFVQDLPKQMNGYDCGVFMVKYADFYSRDIGLCFNQEHMPYFRLRTAKEILRLKAN